MQVTEHVHALKIPFQVKPAPGVVLDRFVYAWLIVGRRICLVDSGVAGADRAIFDYLRSIGRDPGEIAALVLTHSHPDHIGAARTIQQAAGCRVAAPAAERDWIEDVDLQVRQRPVPGFHDLVAGSVQVDLPVQHGDTFDVDDTLRLEVLHTPGHSRGSTSYYFPADGALFCGDAIPLAGDIPIYEDVQAAVRSIRLLQARPDVEVLLSSWDAPRQGDQARDRMADALAWLQRIHQTVLQAAGDAAAPDSLDLCRRVLTCLGIPPAATNPLVARTFLAHLQARGSTDPVA